MRQKEPFLRELARIRQEVNRLFEQALVGAGYEAPLAGLPGMWVPAVDLVEDASAYHLYAELPGVDRSDVRIEVSERRVEISGQRRPVADGNFLRMESRYGPFRWSLELRSAVSRDGLEESFERGVLRLRLPKRVSNGEGG